MTSNQINYQKFLEDQRHNREAEKISDRQATAQEVQAISSTMNAETNQSNLAINSAAVAAQNYATYIQAQRNAEEARHNLIAEQQNQLKIEGDMYGQILGVKIGGAKKLIEDYLVTDGSPTGNTGGTFLGTGVNGLITTGNGKTTTGKTIRKKVA